MVFVLLVCIRCFQWLYRFLFDFTAAGVSCRLAAVKSIPLIHITIMQFSSFFFFFFFFLWDHKAHSDIEFRSRWC